VLLLEVVLHRLLPNSAVVLGRQVLLVGLLRLRSSLREPISRAANVTVTQQRQQQRVFLLQTQWKLLAKQKKASLNMESPINDCSALLLQLQRFKHHEGRIFCNHSKWRTGSE